MAGDGDDPSLGEGVSKVSACHEGGCGAAQDSHGRMPFVLATGWGEQPGFRSATVSAPQA